MKKNLQRDSVIEGWHEKNLEITIHEESNNILSDIQWARDIHLILNLFQREAQTLLSSHGHLQYVSCTVYC